MRDVLRLSSQWSRANNLLICDGVIFFESLCAGLVDDKGYIVCQVFLEPWCRRQIDQLVSFFNAKRIEKTRTLQLHEEYNTALTVYKALNTALIWPQMK